MDLAQKLKLARTSVNLTIEAVSKSSGIGKSSLSEFENGKREPSVSQLARMAGVYRRSVSFFFNDDNPVGGEQIVLWRKRPENVAPMLERQFLKLCEQYQLLEEWTDSNIDHRLPTVEKGRHALSYRDVADLAGRVGNELNLGDRPAFVLLRVLEEDCGVKIFHRDFEPTGTAACAKSPAIGWAILLNSKNSSSRRNYDLAHELFHLLTWDLYRSSREGPIEISPVDEEKLANAFASALLLPVAALTRAVDRKRDDSGKIAVADFVEIARQFDISFEALLWRIHYVYNFGETRQEETRQLIENVKNSPYAKRVDVDGGPRPPSLPDRYRMLARHALSNGEISVGRFAEFMEISRREALSYVETEEAPLGEVQLTPA